MRTTHYIIALSALLAMVLGGYWYSHQANITEKSEETDPSREETEAHLRSIGYVQ